MEITNLGAGRHRISIMTRWKDPVGPDCQVKAEGERITAEGLEFYARASRSGSCRFTVGAGGGAATVTVGLEGDNETQ